MADKKQAKSSSRRGMGFFLGGLIAAVVVGWVVFPWFLYGSKAQPVDFNHKVHVAEAGSCDECHGFRDDGSFVGIPRLDKCKDCHEPDSPYKSKKWNKNEDVFVTQYLRKNKEIPWSRYFRQPDCVFFPHVAHVKRAKLKCEVCHGDWGKLTTLPPYEYNRLTRVSRRVWGNYIGGGFPFIRTDYSKRMKMLTCQKCHTQRRKHDTKACFPCHK